jgi:hypothetical protein
MSKDLIKENEELLLKIDMMIGEKKFKELEEMGFNMLKENTHPSLICSYYVWRHSWPMPIEIEDKLINILDNLRNKDE